MRAETEAFAATVKVTGPSPVNEPPFWMVIQLAAVLAYQAQVTPLVVTLTVCTLSDGPSASELDANSTAP